MARARTVALLGGSFDPPHLGHVALARWALETGEVDEVWFVPCRCHPFGKRLSPWEDRMAMCQHAIDTLGERVRVDPIEAHLGLPDRPSHTIDTVRALSTRHPGVAFRLLGGSDIAGQIRRWREAEKLMALAPPLFAQRHGHEQEREAGEADLPDISSSDVQRRFRGGEPISELVSPGVAAHISERGLYARGPS
jgi:nicotinate-nucleotide adenylyltransferase